MRKDIPKRAEPCEPISRNLPRLRLEVKKSHANLYEVLFKGEVDPHDLHMIESYMRGLEDAVSVAIESKQGGEK